MSALYVTCTQDVGAGVGNAAGCTTRRKHSASGTAMDEGSSHSCNRVREMQRGAV